MVPISTPKCILVVDNNACIRKIIRTFLEGEVGLKVCGEAVDGYDAIEKAEQLRPDLIILELALPRMSGLTAAQTLKKMSPRNTNNLIHFVSRCVSEFRNASRIRCGS